MLFAYIEKAIGAQPVGLMNLKIKANLFHFFMFISKATGNSVIRNPVFISLSGGTNFLRPILPGKSPSI
jgi:hypothetical protein